MRGSVEKVDRQDGHAWRVYIDLKTIDSQQRERITKTFDTKKDAEEWRIKKVNEIKSGWAINPTSLTLEEYLQDWFESHHQKIESTSASKYRRAMEDHIIPQLGSIELRKLSPHHIQQFYEHELDEGRLRGDGGLKASTVRDYHTVLHKALEDAVKSQLIQENPASVVDAPSPKNSEIEYFTVEESKRFLEAAQGSFFENLYHIALMTGLRQSELIGLRWKDISKESQTIRVRHTLVRTSDGTVVSKGPKSQDGKRSVALDDSEMKALSDQRDHQEELKKSSEEWIGNDYNLVFTSRTGTIISPSNLRRDFKRVLREEGLPIIPFNGLRHTHATLLLEQETHPKVVKERLGHSKITVTMDRYSHAIPSMQKDAAEKLSQTFFE